MATPAKDSSGAIVVSIALSALALLVWILLLPGLGSLNSSDAAGNSMAQGFSAIALIVLWTLLTVLMIFAAWKGALPKSAMLAALILVPASGYAALTALELLSRPGIVPYLWPIVIPALVPPLVVLFGFWASVPRLRAAIRDSIAVGVIWGAVFVLSAAIVPMTHLRSAAKEQEAARLAKFDADYARLPADAPIVDLVPFLDTRNETRKSALFDRIRQIESRQSQAEAMLDRGVFPLGYLGQFDLDPTPAICDKARNLLRRRVEPLVLKTAGSAPYAGISGDVADALAAMKWLVGYGCSCDAESLAWENMAKAYRDTSYDVFDLARLRDPNELGRAQREYPARFSMLTPQSHLKAWLGFADDKALREQAVAGARKLDHRTADAVEMLNDKNDISGSWTVFRYLPVLDLEATEALCKAGLMQVRDDLTKVYRPRGDDPRSYSELLSRLGTGQPLTALRWLAGHGCNAESELSQAEDVVRTYQDSPDRTAMLAVLMELRRKP